MSTPGPEPEPAPADEAEQLRLEVARLREEVARAQDGSRSTGRGGWWRTAVVATLLALMTLLAPLAVVATWADDEVGDTDRYVETVTPLASDPAVQAAIADRVTAEIFARLDVRAVIQQAVDALRSRGLPPRVAVGLSALATPLENGVRDFVHKEVSALVASDDFQAAWVEANRTAHGELVAVLSGRTSGAVEVSGDKVNINLAAIINATKSRLSSAGLQLADRIPTVDAQFTIFQSADVVRAQRGFRLLELSSRVLPVVALVLLGAAVALGRSRRGTFVVGALLVSGSMVLLGVGLNLARELYLAEVPTDQLPTAAAAAVYDAVVLYIRTSLRAVGLLFLVAAVLAWVTGPGARPTALRGGGRRLVERVQDRTVDGDPGPVGVAVWTYRTPLRIAVLVVALVAYLSVARPTGEFVLVSTLVVALALLVLELVARRPALDRGQ